MQHELTPIDFILGTVLGAFTFIALGFIAYGIVMYQPIEIDYMGDPAVYEFTKNGG